MTKVAETDRNKGRQASAQDEIEVTPAMVEAGALRLWELAGDDGISRRSSLSEFHWLFSQALEAAGLQTVAH